MGRLEIETNVTVAVREFLPTHVVHVGGNKPSLHFIWKVGQNEDEGELIHRCWQVIRTIESESPVYESQAVFHAILWLHRESCNP